MLRLNVNALLKNKGKTRYWLAKEMDSTFNTVDRICKNNVSSLRLETIEKLCLALECEPGDLFTLK